MKKPKRGEIYLVDFEPTRGAEIKKIRPSVIIQNNVGNYVSDTTIVAPITSKFKNDIYPIEVLVRAPEGGLDLDSVVRLDQIRTVDKARLLQKLGKFSPTTIAKIGHALLISLGLIKL